MNRITPIVLVFVTIAVLGVSGCGGSSSTPGPISAPQPTATADPDLVTQDSPPYAKLAAIEAGSPKPKPSVLAAFKTMMESLGKKCWKDSAENLSDYVVKSQELLKNKGIEMKLSDIARAANNSIPDGTQIANCSEVFALLVSMTSK